MVIEETIQVSFKGVKFFVEIETQEGGRKVVVHEYPGSDERFVEDLGKIPGSFRLNAYVAGDDWVQKDRQLTAKLEEDTEGILELSTFGIIKVKTIGYQKTLRQTEVGRVYYTISFLVSKSNMSPVIAEASIETVAVRAINVMVIMDSIVGGQYLIPATAPMVKTAVFEGVIMPQTITDKITALGGTVDTITGKLKTIRANINDLVRDPVAYAAELFNDGLLGEVFGSVLASRETLAALSELCRIGYNLPIDFKSIEDELLTNAERSFLIPEFADDALYRITANKNRLLITNSLRLSLYAIYLQNAAANEYDTDEDIADVIQDIDDIYEGVVLDDSIDPLAALEVDTCRIETIKVLETKLLITPKISSIDLKVATVDVELAYRLYAETLESVDALTERSTVLSDLNGILSTNFKDEVKILKEQ